MSLLRERAASGSAEDRFLLLARVVPTEDLALDVELTLRHFGADRPEFPGWAYAAREREVMVHGRGQRFAIVPSDVAAIFTRDAPEILVPELQECILLEDGDRATVSGPLAPDGTIATDRGQVAFWHGPHGWSGEIAAPDILSNPGPDTSVPF